GSADDYSDIDLHLQVTEAAWNEVWNRRREFVDSIVPVLAAADVMGIFAIGCLVEGPAKLDVFFERGTPGSHPRIAVKPLWGAPEPCGQLPIGDDLGDAMIARSLENNILGFLQGATWPVRLLARGQLATFLFCELFLIENGLVPLMLLERDRRTFHRNMF